MAEIKYEIVERIAVLGERPRGWERQLNLISWNEGEPKVRHPRLVPGTAPAWAKASP